MNNIAKKRFISIILNKYGLYNKKIHRLDREILRNFCSFLTFFDFINNTHREHSRFGGINIRFGILDHCNVDFCAFIDIYFQNS